MEKSLIDNWSLEHAARLLDENSDVSEIPVDSFTRSLGGLSNFINAALLYDSALFPENGFHADWQKFDSFRLNSGAILHPIQVNGLYEWNAPESYEDIGVANYLVSAERLGADVYLSPERGTQVSQNLFQNPLDETLKYIDNRVNEIAQKAINRKVQVSIQENLLIPALTHYVLSQASNRNDLTTVIVQMIEDPLILSFKRLVSQALNDTDSQFSLRREIDTIVNRKYKLSSSNQGNWQVSIPILGVFSFNKEMEGLGFLRKRHSIFLRQLIACRSEMNSCRKHIDRIFGKNFS